VKRLSDQSVALLAGLLLLAPGAETPVPAATNRFEFGVGPAAPGWLPVGLDRVYTEEYRYGFEREAPPRRDAGRPGDFVMGDQPFLFSAAVAEGNYHVMVTFGDPAAASTNTVKAESRRLMLEQVVTRPGEIVTRMFTVNVRTPALRDGGAVRLKPREQGVLHWDEKLTLEFNGARPAVRRIEIAPAPEAVTVYLLGDSTVTDQPQEPWNSWGQMLPRFFGPGVAVANHAESGESLRGALSARRVAKVLESLRPGDYLFVQFGHNDMKDRATNALAKFELNLRQLVADIRGRAATPVLVTSMERMAGVDQDTLAGYPDTVRRVARETDAPLIDLHAMSRRFYRALGDNLKVAFQDGTHHNAYGSYELAKCIALGIRQNQLPLVKFLTDETATFEPGHPDPADRFFISPSSTNSVVKPDGN
jgi:lysophospholipase L1-like esterase